MNLTLTGMVNTADQADKPASQVASYTAGELIVQEQPVLRVSVS